MTKSRLAVDVLDQEFLPIRAKLLEVAASLDRLNRADGSAASEARLKQVRSAVEVLLGNTDNRAEAIQLIFSRPYEDNWRSKLKV